MKKTPIIRCTCSHAKSIHARMYGPMYVGTKLPHPCNFPGCKCKSFSPDKTK